MTTVNKIHVKKKLKDEGEGGERACGGGSKRGRKEEEVENLQSHMRGRCSGSRK